MAKTWSDLVNEIDALPDAKKNDWLVGGLTDSLAEIGRLRGTPEAPRNVLLYASGWLQKQGASADLLSITSEDLNGVMATIHGMDWDAHLTIVLHTPGGSPTAAQTIVEYLRDKFTDIEVIVPTYAMSAGSMISLAANRIVMGRQSQLGPIDPQISIPGRPTMSARAIVAQFEEATDAINDPATEVSRAAALWGPIVSQMGPSLLQESRNALAFGEQMVAHWLETYMLNGNGALASDVATHFNDASTHLSHGRRIGRAEAAGLGVVVEELEASQDLQEAVLSAYHYATIFFEKSPMVKLLFSSAGQRWMKQWLPPGTQPAPPAAKRTSNPSKRTTPKKNRP